MVRAAARSILVVFVLAALRGGGRGWVRLHRGANGTAGGGEVGVGRFREHRCPHPQRFAGTERDVGFVAPAIKGPPLLITVGRTLTVGRGGAGSSTETCWAGPSRPPAPLATPLLFFYPIPFPCPHPSYPHPPPLLLPLSFSPVPPWSLFPTPLHMLYASHSSLFFRPSPPSSFKHGRHPLCHHRRWRRHHRPGDGGRPRRTLPL